MDMSWTKIATTAILAAPVVLVLGDAPNKDRVLVQ